MVRHIIRVKRIRLYVIELVRCRVRGTHHVRRGIHVRMIQVKHILVRSIMVALAVPVAHVRSKHRRVIPHVPV